MRQIITLFTLLFSFQVTAQYKASLSPLTKIYLLQLEKNKQELPQNYVYRSVGNKTYVASLLKVNAKISADKLIRMGVQIGTKAGNIWTALIPTSQVENLATVDGIEYIQLDEPIHATLDAARAVTRVDSVHDGLSGLTMPYHGDGVVVGIIDAGFDYRHPTLFDTTGTRYRVKKIWEQVNTGTPPATFSYGNEITDTLSMWSKGYDMTISHGAHVSGIAAGSGYGSLNNKQLRGMADAADLVLVGITPPSTDWTTTGMSSIIDALNYIYSYANSVSQPAIANLSWGCSIGSHDGLSLFSQACDNLTGPGKIFALSAGNNGGNNIHVKKTFSASDTLVKTFTTFSSSLGAKKTWIDIWGDTAKNFCVQISLYNGTTATDSTGYICLDNLTHPIYLVNGNNDTFYATVVTTASEFNGKPRIFLDIYNKRSESVMIMIKGNNGTVNMWSGYVQNTTGYYSNFVSNGIAGAVNGDNLMTVGDMASTKSALTVGAFVSKTSITNVSNNVVTYALSSTNGGIASFSSRGPTSDGRVKPDITAPGMVISSAINSYDPDFTSGGGGYASVVRVWTDPKNSRNYSYAALMGTSMSSPAASGIVALMLQANPALTPQLVKDALSQTAITDIKTGTIPAGGSNTWGFGKINAMGAVKRALTISKINTIDKNETLAIYPNPSEEIAYLMFEVDKTSSGLLTITDISGRTIQQQNITINAGENDLPLNVKEFSSGLYFVTLRTVGTVFTGRLLVK